MAGKGIFITIGVLSIAGLSWWAYSRSKSNAALVAPKQTPTDSATAESILQDVGTNGTIYDKSALSSTEWERLNGLLEANPSNWNQAQWNLMVIGNGGSYSKAEDLLYVVGKWGGTANPNALSAPEWQRLNSLLEANPSNWNQTQWTLMVVGNAGSYIKAEDLLYAVGMWGGTANSHALSVAEWVRLKNLISANSSNYNAAQKALLQFVPTSTTPTSTDSKLQSIATLMNNTGTFSSIADAQYLFDNMSKFSIAPDINSVRLALKQSGMAYYDSKVTMRMTQNDVWAIIKQYSGLVNSNFNPPLYGMAFTHDFDAPALGNYPVYQLKKMIAHGWWFGLDSSTGSIINPTATTRGRQEGYTTINVNGNTQFQIFPFDRIHPNDTIFTVNGSTVNVSLHEINDNISAYITDYYLGFGGDAKLKSKTKKVVKKLNLNSGKTMTQIGIPPSMN